MVSGSLEEVRKDLAALRRRMALGEIDEEAYQRQRRLILEDLTSKEQQQLGTATPEPAVSGARLGPSGATGRGVRTALPSLADLDLEPGTVLFEQWRIERELGRGGFGVVFEAHELLLDERQAVKVLDPAMVARAELLARFRREVALMRRLIHPRIVRVYDYREDLELAKALIGMEYVPGGSVKDLGAASRAAGEPLPLSLVLRILGQTLGALGTAHTQGVIHRDVTPGNVLLAGGPPSELLADPERDPGVKLVDFGIAALVERSELSQKSRVLGTAAYVAPEILVPTAAEPQPAADVYGCGAVVYELVTGEPPLGRFERPSALRPGLPAAVEDLVMVLLSRRPPQRPSTSEALEECRRLASVLGREKTQAGIGRKPRISDQEQPQVEAERKLEEEEERRLERAEARHKKEEEEVPRQAEVLAKREVEEEDKRRLAETLHRGKDKERQKSAAAEVEQRARDDKRGQAQADAKPKIAEKVQSLRAEAKLKAWKVARRWQDEAEADLVFWVEKKVAKLPVELQDTAVLSVVEGLDPIEPSDLTIVGALVWALDYYPGRSNDGQKRERARRLRENLVAPLRKLHAPPEPDDNWVEIPAGTFLMGSDSGHRDEQPVHEVWISRFRMLNHVVTASELRILLPARFEDNELPAVGVSWYEAYAYAAWLRGRLPTEAEWEYAARAGTTTRYWSGDDEKDLARAGWYKDNSEGMLHLVREKPPNQWGLYDVHGNVWDWVADWYDGYVANRQSNPWGPPSGRVRVMRGGCWWSDADASRASVRYGNSAGTGLKSLGFRVLLPSDPNGEK